MTAEFQVKYRPSTAKYANIVENRKYVGYRDLKVQNVTKMHEIIDFKHLKKENAQDNISHLKELIELRKFLEKQNEKENPKGTRLGHIYGKDHPLAKEYT